MKLRTYVILPVLALTLSLSETCSNFAHKSPAKPDKNQVVYQVHVVTPTLIDRPRRAEGKGVFEASDRLTVKALLSGTVDKVYVGEGDQVAVGDPLCIFKDDELSALLEKKQAQLKEAEYSLEQSQQSANYFSDQEPTEGPKNVADVIFLDEDLPEKPEPAPKAMEVVDNAPVENQNEANNKVQASEETIEKLNKEIDTLERQLQNLTIKASIAGVVQRRHITEGSLVDKGSALFEIVTINPISFTFNIPQKVSSYIDKLVKVEASPKDAPEIKLEGSIYYISPAIDPKQNTLQIKAHLPNDKNQIREGQEGIASLITRKIDKVLVIPKKAVFREENKSYIYAIEGTQAKKTAIDILGDRDGEDSYEVEAQLRIDDNIITTGIGSIQDGSFVSILDDSQTQSQVAEDKKQENKATQKDNKQIISKTSEGKTSS